MIKIENIKIAGIEDAIRGMRNPMNSWKQSDSVPIYIRNEETDNEAFFDYLLGDADKSLAMGLNAGGPAHSKYRRMMVVWCDITAPLYWWKEFDTYKVGTVANSCSTMHKLASRDLTLDDFSCEHLFDKKAVSRRSFSPKMLLKITIDTINEYRREYVEKPNKDLWWQMIQLLPSSYNQKRTVMLNYEVLAKIYAERENHKLDEWNLFREWIKTLEYSDLITGGKENE